MRVLRSAPLLVGLLLACGTQAASAAAVGSFATSVGLFTALAALVVVKGWPGHLSSSMLSSAAASLAVAAAAVWLFRAQLVPRLAAALPARPQRRLRGGVRPNAPALVLPAGWDRECLLADLRRLFVEVQAAWDSGDADCLDELVAPELLAEFRRERSLSGGPHGTVAGARTDVVSVSADLLGFERLALASVVCVEFSGWLREDGAEAPVPFREWWLLTRPDDGSGRWRLTRHQALL